MRVRAATLLGAAAVVWAGAYVAVCAAALFGRAAIPETDRALTAAAALGLAVVTRPRPADRTTGVALALGAAVGFLAVVAVDGGSGATRLVAGVVGGLVAIGVWAFVVSRRPQLLDSRFVIAVALALLAAFVVVATARAVISGGALGHDESAYAVKARSWVGDAPASGWDLHRAPLLSLLGAPLVAIGSAEGPLRVLAVLLALGALGAVGLVAHRLGGWWAVPLAVGVVGASVAYLRRGSEYLTDVPAAGLLLASCWLVLGLLRDPPVAPRRAYWLAPLVAAAFYMRYQSSLAVVAMALGALAAWPAEVRRLLPVLWRTAALTVVLLLPHAIWAMAETGTPWGVVTYTQGKGGRAYLGEGLGDYAEMFPDDLAGRTGAIAIAVAALGVVLGIVRAIGRRRLDRDARTAIFVAVVVAVSVVPLGLVAHGEERFVFFPVWLLIATGAAVVVRFASWIGRRGERRWAVAALAAAVLAWLAPAVDTARFVDRNAESRSRSFQVLVDASRAIADDGEGTCGVLTTYGPQITWYSSCTTSPVLLTRDDLGVRSVVGDRRYVLLFEHGKREPTGEDEAQLLALGPVTVVPDEVDAIGDATIVRIVD